MTVVWGMGNRLTKIYTRTGDDGQTGLADGSRVNKTSPRVEAMGDVDELNSALGVMLSGEVNHPYRSAIEEIQHRLFDLGGELSIPGAGMVNEQHVKHVEDLIDGINADLPPLKEFILPGGSRGAASCHLARAVCRRAERVAWALADQMTVNPDLLKYLNRLSDWFFVAARVANDGGKGDVLWVPGANR